AVERADAVDRVRALLAEDDHRHAPVPAATRLAFAEAPADLETRAAGELARHEDEIGMGALGEVERLARELGPEHVEAVADQLLLQEAAHIRLGLGEKERGGHAIEASA